MLNRVLVMKRSLLLLLLVCVLLLKMLFPSGVLLQRKILGFLGLEQETVQALGRRLYEASP